MVSNRYKISSEIRGTNVFAILSKIVSLRTPARLLTARGGILGKEQIQVRQIFDVDIAPDSLSLPNMEGLPTFEGLTGNARNLAAASISRAGPLTVNGGWANNCNLQRVAATTKNDLVNITMRVSSLRERGDFGNVLDVIVDLGVKLAEFVGFCEIAEDSRARSVDEI